MQAIIFDLGGVLLNVNYQAPLTAFARLGITAGTDWFSQKQQAQLFNELETGAISPQKFFCQIRSMTRVPVSDAALEEAWNSILGDFPLHRWEMLQDLKKRYRLFLLSNTNTIHLKAFEKIIENSLGLNALSSIFEKLYYSHQVGLRKPDPEVFKRVINDAALVPRQTFFVDDTQQHVESARQCGLQAHWLNTQAQDITALAHQLGWCKVKSGS